MKFKMVFLFNLLFLFANIWPRTVMISDFYYTIVVAKIIYDNDIIFISTVGLGDNSILLFIIFQ